MNSEPQDFSTGDLVILSTEKSSVRKNLSSDSMYYTGFYKTIIPMSSRPSSGWRRWVGPKKINVVGIILGPASARQTDNFERAYVLWDGEIVESRCNHLKKVQGCNE